MARSYNQECVLAYALEILGERWTLLIVRELFLGPRRFADLTAGLPGLGSNLLSKRLKELEALDIIENSILPGTRGQYRLTEYGERLRPTIQAMIRWSVGYLLKRTETNEAQACIHSNNLNPDSVALAVETFAICVKPHDADYVAHLQIDEEPYTVFNIDGTLTVRRGHDAPAVATMMIPVAIAMQALRGEVSPARLRSLITETGRESVIDHLADLFTINGKHDHTQETLPSENSDTMTV